MTLRILDEAHDDASEAAQWYENHRSGLGHDFLTELSDAYRSVEQNPSSHPRVEHPQVTAETRRVLLQRFPFLVIYELIQDEPLVIAVAHASRDPSFWTSRSQGG